MENKLTPSILAMYLGVECLYKDDDGNEHKSAIMSVTVGGLAFMMEPDEELPIESKDIRLILRPLSSMSMHLCKHGG